LVETTLMKSPKFRPLARPLGACVARITTSAVLIAALSLAGCRTMPGALSGLVPGGSENVAIATDDEPSPANGATAENGVPGRSPTQVLGVSYAEPARGEPLPTIPRDHQTACPPPLPYVVHGPWAPPGLKHPYPADEYLHDGGDAAEPVGVSPDWRVQGLNVEDTVAHYETLDGRTLVEPSNCAYVYAPRFNSVRSVTGVVSGESSDNVVNVQKEQNASRFVERSRVGRLTDQQQPVGQVGNLKPSLYAGDVRHDGKSTNLLAGNAQQTFMPFEDLSIIHEGVMSGAEKARLAEATDAAVIWSKDIGVQVHIGGQKAVVHTGDRRAQAIFTVKEPTNAKLRICKVASSPAAQPGDTIDFTIRYDNVGDAIVGNVVILDSLTTRLEYEPESAQSSRKAQFSTTVNAAESLELRWEISEPIRPGEGGIVRFRCRVR
jgi:uncharacterized repeat protein (TIGR01451 family)